MTFEAVREKVRSLREISAWPEVLQVINRTTHREGLSVWDYPLASCRAAGGTEEAALPGSAAVFCSLLSIHLIDDMLDDEPGGDFRRLGNGPTANIAIALQAAGHRVLSDPSLPPHVSAAAQASLARMALGTAYGQGLDTREARDEDEYWQIVEAKTPPLFGAAFELGAVLAGAPRETVERLERIGRILGRFVQVSDDLSDALQTPAKVDWNRPSNNLAILYAMTASHPARDRFRSLAARPNDPEALTEAHQILVKSGSVSYCAFKMIEFSQQAQDLLDSAPLPDPEPVSKILRQHLRPLHRLLDTVETEEPALISV